VTATAATLEPFIGVDELRAALADAELDVAQAAWLCEWGSAAVRAEVGQTINVVEGDTVTVDGTGSWLVLLPEIEVRDVTAVAVHGADLDESGFEWNAAGCLWRLGGARGLLSGRARWPSRPRSIQVTYDHGWAPPSPQWDAARHVALDVATRTFRNPEMLQSERIGDYSRAWVPTGGRAQLTEIEKRALDLLRRGV